LTSQEQEEQAGTTAYKLLLTHSIFVNSSLQNSLTAADASLLTVGTEEMLN
jgi:hypothetical protein